MVHPTVIRNIKDMCEDRGYNILCEKDGEIITDKCYILFTKDIKININYIKELTRLMTEQSLEHIVVVYNGNITMNAQSINDIQMLYNIEFFSEKSFMYNITKHALVPLHEKLCKTSEEYRLIATERHNLPHIFEKDPVCKYYNFKQGDVLRITRNRGIVAYRLVV
jgi:DNA-directed RNA polymerase subunit H (RpoH/RPB5)